MSFARDHRFLLEALEAQDLAFCTKYFETYKTLAEMQQRDVCSFYKQILFRSKGKMLEYFLTLSYFSKDIWMENCQNPRTLGYLYILEYGFKNKSFKLGFLQLDAIMKSVFECEMPTFRFSLKSFLHILETWCGPLLKEYKEKSLSNLISLLINSKDKLQYLTTVLETFSIELSKAQYVNIFKRLDITKSCTVFTSDIRNKLKKSSHKTHTQNLYLEYIDARIFHLTHVLGSILPIPQRVVEHVLMKYVDCNLEDEVQNIIIWSDSSDESLSEENSSDELLDELSE